MAGTYYNYAERKADSYVNWGEIGKSISTMLSEENKIREEKKAAIDKTSLEFGETLSNAPQGDSKDLNEWALEYAANAQEARLMQDRLLKSGQLSVKDYTMMRQNITDGTTQAFNLIKEYQAEYATKMERYKTEKSQELERWLMEQAEGFGNFKMSSLYINPTDFKVSVGFKEKKIVDGKEVYGLSTDVNKFTTVNALRNRIKGSFDRYDVSGNISRMVETLGEEKSAIQQIASLHRTGSITETLDITKRSNLPKDAQGVIIKFEEAETKMLQAQLQNPYNVSSILTNTIGTAPNGKPYSFTFSEEEAKKNKNLILLKDSASGTPVPSFTPEQEKAALERLRLEARMMYDKTTETKVTPQIQLQERRPQTEAEMTNQNIIQNSKNLGQQLGKLLTGSPADRLAARDYFNNMPRFKGSTITEDKIVLVDAKTGQNLTFNIGNPKDKGAAERMVRAMARTLSDDGTMYEKDIINAALGVASGKPLQTGALGTVSKEPRDITSDVTSYVTKALNEGVDKKDTRKTSKALVNSLSGLGFAFDGKTDGLIFKDRTIGITPPNGKERKEFEIDDLAGMRAFILANQDPSITRGSGLFRNEPASSNVGARYN